MSIPEAAPHATAHPGPDDFARTGPGTPAGEYLRRFWHPVYHSVDLKPASAVPLRVMGQAFTLYRAESGKAVLMDGRCPHRGTLLSSGWVEGEELRCFYHGWKFDPTGACTEQPAEKPDFCRKVRIGAYPVREYLGLVFAYIGQGEPLVFPEHPEFEHFDGLLELDSYSRDCNFFQNLENALDMSHVGFVHGDNRASFAGIGDGKRLKAAESDWGVTYAFTRPDGQQRVQQFGMPNLFYMTALPTDPEIGWQESLFWWVQIEDDLHMQFSIHRVPARGEAVARIHARRQKRSEGITIAHQDYCEQILAGEALLRDADATKVDLVRLQDDIAQVGQGRIADRTGDRLGRADVGVIAIRKLWARELDNAISGRPLKHWKRDASIVPRAWSLDGGGARIGAEGLVADGSVKAMIVDVRPQVEVKMQLRALHGRRHMKSGESQ